MDQCSDMLCCGMAGIMGCKQDFHHKSLEMAKPLLHKIREINPDVLVTECLSCRLQFNQTVSFPQAHPVEILAGAYLVGVRMTNEPLNNMKKFFATVRSKIPRVNRHMSCLQLVLGAGRRSNWEFSTDC